MINREDLINLALDCKDIKDEDLILQLEAIIADSLKYDHSSDDRFEACNCKRISASKLNSVVRGDEDIIFSKSVQYVEKAFSKRQLSLKVLESEKRVQMTIERDHEIARLFSELSKQLKNNE